MRHGTRRTLTNVLSGCSETFRCKVPDGSQFDKLTVTSLIMTNRQACPEPVDKLRTGLSKGSL